MKDNLVIYEVFDKDTVESVYKLIESIEEPRWIRRTKLQPGRAINNSTCAYDYCNHMQMKKEMKEQLKEIAPVYEDFKLADLAVNRYKIGDYIGQHKDKHDFRRNLVISLQESGDGLYIDEEDKFVEDKIGQGVLIEGIGPIHSVPPAKKLRYSLVYLYE